VNSALIRVLINFISPTGGSQQKHIQAKVKQQINRIRDWSRFINRVAVV